MEATVTQDTGTVVTETPVVETTTTTTETSKPTLAETERLFRETYDKEHGRDVSKLFPQPIKKVEVKTETKTEEKPVVKTEEKKVETKVETEAPKKPSGFSRTRYKLELAKQENQMLKDRLAALETRVDGKTTTTEVKTEARVEPKREDFKTDLEYFNATRKFDKDTSELEKKTEKEQQSQDQLNAQFEREYGVFQTELESFKKTHPDWDEKKKNSKVVFEPILLGVLIKSGPETLYHFADNQRQARNLNDMLENSVIAVGNSDDVSGVLKYLAANPDDIDKLNSLNPVKAQTFIGKIEAKIESGAATATSDDKSKRTQTGADDKSEKTVAAATETTKPTTTKTETKPAEVQATKVVADRARPEPPAKVSGEAPSSADWTDSGHMSLKEREAKYREDFRYAKKR